MAEISNESKKRMSILGSLGSWNGPKGPQDTSPSAFDAFKAKMEGGSKFYAADTDQTARIPTQPVGIMPAQSQAPLHESTIPAAISDRLNQRIPTGAVSNLYTPSTNVQPNQLQSLNPYAGVQIAGVSQAPFVQEQRALSNQGSTLAKATAEQGKSMQNLSSQQGKYFQDLQGKSAANIDKYKDETKNFDSQLDQINKQYPLLNRKQVLDNMSVGDKIFSAIGTIFGGAGAGMTGGSNVALDLVNKNIDSIINTNSANYQRAVETLNSKRAKSASDFEMTRQSLNDNATMQNNIFQSVKDHIDAKYKETSSPAVKYQLEAAGAQVMQRMASMNQQNALQNMQLQLQGRQWAAQMAMNPRAVQLGTDAMGKPIQGVAASDKSAEVLREQLPQLENKISTVRDMINYLNQAPNSAGKSQSLIGNNLEGMKQNVAKAFGLDPKEMPDIVKTAGRDATDFYNQLLSQASKNKQDVINANVIK